MNLDIRHTLRQLGLNEELMLRWLELPPDNDLDEAIGLIPNDGSENNPAYPHHPEIDDWISL